MHGDHGSEPTKPAFLVADRQRMARSGRRCLRVMPSLRVRFETRRIGGNAEVPDTASRHPARKADLERVHFGLPMPWSGRPALGRGSAGRRTEYSPLPLRGIPPLGGGRAMRRALASRAAFESAPSVRGVRAGPLRARRSSRPPPRGGSRRSRVGEYSVRDGAAAGSRSSIRRPSFNFADSAESVFDARARKEYDMGRHAALRPRGIPPYLPTP